MAAPRSSFPILLKLLLAHAAPTLLLFAVFGWYVHDQTRRQLDEELGKRLASIAASTATQIRGKYLVDLAPGDEQDRAYLNTQRILDSTRHATDVQRLFVFRPDRTTLVDTLAEARIGTPLYQLDVDQAELDRTFSGIPTSSVLFKDAHGELVKTGYAPVRGSEDDTTIVAALAATAPAAYFDRLVDLERRILAAGILLAVVVILSSLVVAAIITRPIRQLATRAAAIGKGNLDTPIPSAGHDEITILARTLEEMRTGLAARDQRLQIMLAGIAHEVRNPLAGMNLYAGILRDELAADSENQSHVKRIERELTHLETVVTEFLDYARRPPIEPRPLDMPKLLTEVAELCQPQADASGAHLETTCPPELRVTADPHQLRRALLNLARNALQAAPQGNVQLCAEPITTGTRITVTDDGPGIPPETQTRMFDPFFTTREKGTGLGLAFVAEIVRDHKGTLRVESTPNEGTTFTLEL